MELVEQIQQVNRPTGKDNFKPTMTTWKKASMMRAHSLRATVNEILSVSRNLDLVKIGIVGEPSSGKTELSKTLAHLIHKMSYEQKYVPWAIRLFGEDEFLNIKKTLDGLEPANYVLIFDDLSFLENRKAIEEVKRVVTKIRHMREDVKIILIYDYHYTLGFDKYLRQTNFKYITSMGESEIDNIIKLMGTQYTPMINDFKEKYVEMTGKTKCTFVLPKNKVFVYDYKNPFVVCLFWNQARARYVVFPLREWIDPICSICAEATGQLLKSNVSIPEFAKKGEDNFGPGNFLAGVKLKLYTQGLTTYGKHVVNALKWISKAQDQKLISLEELAIHYNLTTTKTRLRKKVDLDDISLDPRAPHRDQ